MVDNPNDSDEKPIENLEPLITPKANAPKGTAKGSNPNDSDAPTPLPSKPKPEKLSLRVVVDTRNHAIVEHSGTLYVLPANMRPQFLKGEKVLPSEISMDSAHVSGLLEAHVPDLTGLEELVRDTLLKRGFVSTPYEGFNANHLNYVLNRVADFLNSRLPK